ncbi:MAG: NAD(P)H-dependent oxidoreductase [Proteobacteria bacterium]|nr:NAD(P)H-dependent oxidoreductase [Pseudomonadota bacterium]
MKILHVDSSINGKDSFSKKLSLEIVEYLEEKNQDVTVKYVDLSESAPAHFSVNDFESIENNHHLTVFLSCDVIVIGAPMYNFTIPTQLKAWLDRLAVSGKTFRYSSQGVEGLVRNKRVILALSRGGYYFENDALKDFEHQESYLKCFFKFIGVENIETIRLEGINLGDKGITKAFLNARHAIKQLK